MNNAIIMLSWNVKQETYRVRKYVFVQQKMMAVVTSDQEKKRVIAQ